MHNGDVAVELKYLGERAYKKTKRENYNAFIHAYCVAALTIWDKLTTARVPRY